MDKNEFFDFDTLVTKDIILKPQYYSLEILDKSNKVLSEKEKNKYTKDSIIK